QDATHANVLVEAFFRPTYAAADLITSFNYTIPLGPSGILVDAGAGDDRIVVDATLGVHVQIDGQAGNDQLVVLGNGVTDAVYSPGDQAPLRLDGTLSFKGNVTAGLTSIDFEGFEPAGSVTIQDVPNVRFATAGPNGSGRP